MWQEILQERWRQNTKPCPSLLLNYTTIIPPLTEALRKKIEVNKDNKEADFLSICLQHSSSKNDSGRHEEWMSENITGGEWGKRRRTTNDRPNKYFLVSLLHGNLMTLHQTRVLSRAASRLMYTIFSLRKVKQEARGIELKKSFFHWITVHFLYFVGLFVFVPVHKKRGLVQWEQYSRCWVSLGSLV